MSEMLQAQEKDVALHIRYWHWDFPTEGPDSTQIVISYEMF